jgi:type II secretory pathway pseudopilin PulG
MTAKNCFNSDESTQGGFTYVWVLIAISIMSVGLTAIAEVWITSVRTQKLTELDWVGAQFVTAIGSFYEATPGVVVKIYPRSLDELLEDRRYLSKKRHLRQIYQNPFTGQVDWRFVMASEGGIKGVRIEAQHSGKLILREYTYSRDLPR